MLEIDGSLGGGQMLRTSLSLSALLGIPFCMSNIRKSRGPGGLKPQHLVCLRTVASLCNADVEGDSLESTSITFIPGKLQLKNVDVDIGTAGSVTLLLQAILPLLMFGNKQSTITLRGGTNVSCSMPVEFVQNVLLHYLKPFCEFIQVSVLKRGYYPVGGGEVEVVVRPKYSMQRSRKEFLSDLRASTILFSYVNRGHLALISGVSHAAKSLEERQVSERQAECVRALLAPLSIPFSITSEYAPSLSTGSGVTLWAKCSEKEDIIPSIILGVDSLGAPKKYAEDVGVDAAKNLLSLLKSVAVVDEHVADNLIPFMALLGRGEFITSTMTDHIRSNIAVCEQFLDTKFTIEHTRVIARLS